jgi:molecular chaperone IbpA
LNNYINNIESANSGLSILTCLTKGDKMTNRQLSIFNQLRPLSIGFDNVFNHFESMLNDDFGLRVPTVNYPPYNIVETSKNNYDIEVALAGYNKKDIDVTFENGQLTIKSKKSDETKDKDGNTIYKGIAKRYFERSFTIADDVEIIGAELKDGLLKVSLEKIIPESKKRKTIDIK